MEKKRKLDNWIKRQCVCVCVNNNNNNKRVPEGVWQQAEWKAQSVSL